jgi:hypothetical protein
MSKKTKSVAQTRKTRRSEILVNNDHDTEELGVSNI